MYSTYTSSLHKLLVEKADPKTSDWWESYVKNSAPFLGVKMADIRAAVHQWHQEQIAGNLTSAEQRDLALALFSGQYSEEKLAGTLFLQEILLPADTVNCKHDLERFAILFSDGLIYDWNICDWFSIKVLGTLIKMFSTPCAKTISGWHKAENLWQARASLVAFVPVAEMKAYYPLIEVSCHQIIRRDERFAKTSVGWILRDISKHDQDLVERIIEQNIDHFSVESLKNATKYFNQQDKNLYMKMLRDTQTTG
jgi:3-methyladenine DNA glycosylase AlkD